jgi:hypothetical protein
MIARVNRKASRIGVVEVEITESGAIGEGGEVSRRASVGADNGGVATVLAQISCNGSLPQGSPCSPIVSDIVAHILDVRLARLAKAHGCIYSRYADDLTFSTNEKEFSTQLATLSEGTATWVSAGARNRTSLIKPANEF